MTFDTHQQLAVQLCLGLTSSQLQREELLELGERRRLQRITGVLGAVRVDYGRTRANKHQFPVVLAESVEYKLAQTRKHMGRGSCVRRKDD